MWYEKATLALIAVLAAAVCVSAQAGRGSGGKSGGKSGGSSQASSGARSGGHSHSGNHAHHRGARPRIGAFLGAPVYAAPIHYYYSPGYGSRQPVPVYIEQDPAHGYWYFCPESNEFYPYVQECPVGWQQVVPFVQAPAPGFPG